MGRLRILLADDHIVRRGLRNVLEARSDWIVVAEASNGPGRGEAGRGAQARRGYS